MSEQPEKPEPYLPDMLPTNAEWNRAVAEWGWQEVRQDIWLTTGKCPYCGDTTSELVEWVDHPVFLNVQYRPNLEEALKQEMVVVVCQCDVDHPPQKARSGCGMRAQVPAPPHTPHS